MGKFGGKIEILSTVPKICSISRKLQLPVSPIFSTQVAADN